MSAGLHMLAYGGCNDSLFRGGMMQSGNPVNFRTYNYDTYDFLNASSQLGCGNASLKLDCLRGIDAKTLDTWLNSTAGLYFDWKPIIAGDVIQGGAYRAAEQRQFCSRANR